MFHSDNNIIPNTFITKVKIPWDLITSKYKKETSPLNKLGQYLKAALNMDDDEQIDVTKIYVNKQTEDKLDELMLNYLKKTYSSTGAKKALSYGKLFSYPACDYDNTYNLMDGYVYVKDKYNIKINENKGN